MTTKKPYTCTECGEPCSGKWVNMGLGWIEVWGVKNYDNIPEFVSDCCSEPIDDEWECDDDPRY